MDQNNEYMVGIENTLIRYYYYLNRGLDIINQFRNLFLGIITLYIALKFTNLLWAIGMFIISIPILVIVGRYNTHKILKNSEYLSTQFSTHYALTQFDYIKEQVELLKEIRNE